MSIYRVRLALRSPLGTPLVADTLFGHLCWGIAYHEGAGAVSDFLHQMSDDEPPLVISDPLPEGHWPMPILSPPSAQAYDELLVGQVAGGYDVLTAHDRIRAARKREWVPHTVWQRHAAALDSAAILRSLLDNAATDPVGLIAATIARNTIDRLSGHTREAGGLYFQQVYYPARDARYDVWARSSWNAGRLRDVMSWGLEGGYGRDAGVGTGQLDVLSVESADLPTATQPNGIMTLGRCVPAADDPADGLWNTDVRHGRLGGAWARMADPEDQSGVFKYPVVFLGCGAVFRTDQPRPVMGRVVPGVHPTRPEVVTCGLTLTLPVHLSEEALPCPSTA